MLTRGDVVANRFEIERSAGKGGMGTVYRAKDRLTGGAVAIKMLTDARHAERFLREGRVLAELRHPSIVEYVAHGVAPNGDHYLVMEWLEGEDLAERMGKKPLTRAESLVMIRAVAGALAATHARGVVHRDIKPSNLFLVDGDVAKLKLLDFGIARLGDATRAATAVGAFLGTPGYMAPEQALGEQVVDARADVFSLGCVLYECLAGRPVFLADHVMALLAKIVLEEAPRVRALREDVPEALDDLVARMLSKDREQRLGSGAAVVDALDALGTMPSEKVRVGPSSRAPARLTEREQRLVSVVLAGAAQTTVEDLERDATLDASAASTSELVRRAVAPFGVRLDRLADGTLIATLAGRGTPADQAAQAARCALAIRAVLANVPIVLATGRTVVLGALSVGEVIDRSTRLLRQVARARAASVGHEVHIDEATAGLLGAGFQVGGDESGLVLLGERERADTTRHLLGKPTPCVGRTREVNELSAVFEDCVSEPVARAVLVTAPPGVGKSRLRYEFLRALERRGGAYEVWVGRGDPMSAGSPFAMLAQALREAAGLREGEPLSLSRQKLRARVTRHVAPEDSTRVAEFLGEVVGVPFPESVQLGAARNEPSLMGDQMRRAWEDFVAAECSAQPVLLVLEDLHWGDLPTVRFVEAALRTLSDLPFMVLAVARPEVHELFPRLWAERRTQEIRLEELTKRASERLVRDVLGESVSAEVVSQIVGRAAGNAFYLEELIRAVAEGKGETLPETVLAMAQARLEVLEPPARLVLRAASVFGGSFWRAGVQRLVGGGDVRKTQGVDWLDELVHREIVTPRRESKFEGQAEFSFRHALVREAAYASLTDTDRVLGHKLAAKWLESVHERDAMTLAEHYERGGDPQSAARYFFEAAANALRGNDFTAAVARADRAIAGGAEGDTRGQLRLIQAEAHRWTGEFAEAERYGAEAFDLLPPRTPTWYACIGELASAAGIIGNHERLAVLSNALKEALETGDASGPLVIASARASVQLLHSGQYRVAGEFLDKLDAVVASSATDDPAVLGWLGRARMLQASNAGDPDRTRRHAAASARFLDAAGDLRTACLQRMNLGFSLNELGLYAEAETVLRAALADAERIGLRHVVAPGKTFLGYALAGLQKNDLARAAETEAIALFSVQGDKRMEAASRNHLARVLLAEGDAEGSVAEARAALALCDKIPGMRATSCGALAAGLLVLGAGAEALSVAKDGMEIMASLGRVDQGEARLRLAHALALAQTGDRDGARAAIVTAKDRVLARAATIEDACVKQAFLENVEEHARTIALCADWA